MRATKLLSILVSSLLVVAAFVSLRTEAFAATTLSLSPASGTLGPTFSIDVLIDSGTEDLPGVALYVDYTGPVTYTTAEDGDISGCNYSESSGRISIACLPLSSFSGSKTVATLNFTVTEAGEVSMAIPESGVDIGQPEHTLGGTSGGTYTVTTTATGDDDTGDDDDDTGTGTSTSTGTQLPSSGLITGGVLVISLGLVLLTLGIVTYFWDHNALLSLIRNGHKPSLSESHRQKKVKDFENRVVTEEFGE